MITPEFARLIPVDRIGLKEKSFDIDADAKERKALAQRLGIPEVRKVAAQISLKLIRGGSVVLLKGRVQAGLVQNCVVTLDPVDTEVDEEFTLTYSVESKHGPSEVVVDLAEEDPPEPVENGQIDIGEAAAEHLALAMDPFPRAPGVSFQAPPETPIEEPKKANPFEVLATPRKKV
jgi:uncharacterized metal-binding protein YceD (DUF177 family)